MAMSAASPMRGPRRVSSIAGVIVGTVIGAILVVATQTSGTLYGISRYTGGQGSTGSIAAPTKKAPATAKKKTPADQAKQVDALLDDSAAGRQHMVMAIDHALACSKSKAVAEIKTAAGARLALRDRAKSTDFSALTDGNGLKSALVAFLNDSYRADQAYLNWVQSTVGSCPSTSASAFTAVTNANSKARKDKTTFLNDWNPIARKYGLPTRDVKEI